MNYQRIYNIASKRSSFLLSQFLTLILALFSGNSVAIIIVMILTIMLNLLDLFQFSVLEPFFTKRKHELNLSPVPQEAMNIINRSNNITQLLNFLYGLDNIQINRETRPILKSILIKLNQLNLEQ